MNSDSEDTNFEKKPKVDLENSDIFSLESIDDSWMDETDVFTRDKDGRVTKRPRPVSQSALPPGAGGQESQKVTGANVPHRALTSGTVEAPSIAPEPPAARASSQPPPPPKSSMAPPVSDKFVGGPPPMPQVQKVPSQALPVTTEDQPEKIRSVPGVPRTRVAPSPDANLEASIPKVNTSSANAVTERLRPGFHYFVEKTNIMTMHGEYLDFANRIGVAASVSSGPTNAAQLGSSVSASASESESIRETVLEPGQSAGIPAPIVENVPNWNSSIESSEAPGFDHAPNVLNMQPDVPNAFRAEADFEPTVSSLVSGFNPVLKEQVEQAYPNQIPVQGDSPAPSQARGQAPLQAPAQESIQGPSQVPSQAPLQVPSPNQASGPTPAQVLEPAPIHLPGQDSYNRAAPENVSVPSLEPEQSDGRQGTLPGGSSRDISEFARKTKQPSKLSFKVILLSLTGVGILFGAGLYQLKEFVDSDKKGSEQAKKLKANNTSLADKSSEKSKSGEGSLEEQSPSLPVERWSRDFEKGLKYFDSEQFDKAIVYFSTSISEDSTKPQVFHLRGKAYSRAKDYEHAIQDFSRALKLKGDEENILLDRAAAYIYSDESRRAIRDYSRILKVNPENAKASYGRALAYVKEKKYDLALSDFQSTVDSDPAYVNAYLQIGLLYAGDDKNEDAIKAFSSAIGIKKSANLYYERSLAYYALGKYEKALNDLNSALSMKSDKKEYYNDRGYINLKLGRKDKARLDFEAALKIDPSYELAKQNLEKSKSSF